MKEENSCLVFQILRILTPYDIDRMSSRVEHSRKTSLTKLLKKITLSSNQNVEDKFEKTLLNIPLPLTTGIPISKEIDQKIENDEREDLEVVYNNESDNVGVEKEKRNNLLDEQKDNLSQSSNLGENIQDPRGFKTFLNLNNNLNQEKEGNVKEENLSVTLFLLNEKEKIKESQEKLKRIEIMHLYKETAKEERGKSKENAGLARETNKDESQIFKKGILLNKKQF